MWNVDAEMSSACLEVTEKARSSCLNGSEAASGQHGNISGLVLTQSWGAGIFPLGLSLPLLGCSAGGGGCSLRFGFLGLFVLMMVGFLALAPSFG